jgi:hypothetical protein
MSATITTQHNRRVPLATALAIAGVLTAAGALGVAWEQSNDSSTPAETTGARTATAQDYMKYNYYHGPNAAVGPRVNKAPTSVVPNATVAELGSSFKAPTGQAQVPNATIAENLNSTFQAPTSGGRVQLGY